MVHLDPLVDFEGHGDKLLGKKASTAMYNAVNMVFVFLIFTVFSPRFRLRAVDEAAG